MGPHNFQKHNIRYPRSFTSTSTASSTFPSHSGSSCAWATAPPTLFPSFYSPALHSTYPELPSPSISPHYQSSPTFFSHRDITPTTSCEIGRMFDSSMSGSLSCEAQEEGNSPLGRQTGTHHRSNIFMSIANSVHCLKSSFWLLIRSLDLHHHVTRIVYRRLIFQLNLLHSTNSFLFLSSYFTCTGTVRTNQMPFNAVGPALPHSSDNETPLVQPRLMNPTPRMIFVPSTEAGSGNTTDFSYTTGSSGSCRSGYNYRASTGGISESGSRDFNSLNDSGNSKERGMGEEEMAENELENSFLLRGKSCPMPHSPSSSSSSSPRGVHRFHHAGGSRDINGIAHTRNPHTSSGHISVNDDTLAEALLVHGGKLLVEELERAVTLLVEQMRLEKQK